MRKNIKKYFKVWLLMSRNSFVSMLSNRLGAVFFLLGKLIRFAVFLLFIVFLLKGSKTLAGYDLNQTVFFFLTFNLVDIASQFLFREVYRFRPLVVEGGFDLILSKPINALFRSLMGGADILDLISIPPLIAAIVFVARNFNPSFGSVLLYSLLILNGLLLAAAFHIAVLSLGIITLEIDHTILIYRDLTSLGRFPIDIYKEPLKGILTYLVPVGIMISVPAKSLMGLVSSGGVLASFIIGIFAVVLSLKFWNFALTKYSSVSS